MAGHATNDADGLAHARALLDAGDAGGAERVARELVESEPTADALECLARAMHAQGRMSEALVAFQRMVSADPTRVHGFVEMGACFQAIGAHEQAAQSLRIAVDLDPHNVPARLRLARTLLTLRDATGARHCAQALVDEGVLDAEALVVLGLASETEGNTSESQEWFRRALEHRPNDPALIYGFVRVGGELEADDVARRLEEGPLSESQRSDLCFALGMLRDRLGDYGRAFEAYLAANRARGATWDPDAFDALIARIARVSSRDYFEQRMSWGRRGAAPIFVVGMPRTGSSLVEQILAAHPNVVTLGEHSGVAKLCTSIRAGAKRFPEVLEDLERSHVDMLAQRYLDGLPTDAAGMRTVDKALATFLRLGLVGVMFPDARIIHCRRDPMDASVSAFCQNFDRSNLPYAYDLEHLGRTHAACDRLMDHWRDALPQPILDVWYEKLVSDPQKQIRRLVLGVGLEWNDACLDFHASRRAVFTASTRQVREPVHTRSCGKWRRYETYLGPLKRALAG